MNYSLHPEALGDLREAASFYSEQAGTNLSQSFLGEFEQSINRLLLTPWTWVTVARTWTAQVPNEALSIFFDLYKSPATKFAFWRSPITAVVRTIGLGGDRT